MANNRFVPSSISFHTGIDRYCEELFPTVEKYLNDAVHKQYVSNDGPHQKILVDEENQCMPPEKRYLANLKMNCPAAAIMYLMQQLDLRNEVLADLHVKNEALLLSSLDMDSLDLEAKLASKRKNYREELERVKFKNLEKEIDSLEEKNKLELLNPDQTILKHEIIIESNYREKIEEFWHKNPQKLMDFLEREIKVHDEVIKKIHEVYLQTAFKNDVKKPTKTNTSKMALPANNHEKLVSHKQNEQNEQKIIGKQKLRFFAEDKKVRRTDTKYGLRSVIVPSSKLTFG